MDVTSSHAVAYSEGGQRGGGPLRDLGPSHKVPKLDAPLAAIECKETDRCRLDSPAESVAQE